MEFDEIVGAENLICKVGIVELVAQHKMHKIFK